MNFKSNLIALRGEIVKQNKNYHNSLSSILSLLIWPIMNLIYIFFLYKSFNISYLSRYGITTINEFIIFLITGALVYNCFWSMVQSAFYLSFERQNGTLESVFITPVNILSYLYGRALGGIITSLWMYFSFSFIILFLTKEFSIKLIMVSVVAVVVVVFSATVWGGFINAIFLSSRDANYLFTICDEPMRIFSGSTVPILAFPIWGQIISYIFPATYCLYIVRNIYMSTLFSLNMYIYFILSLLILIALTFIIAKVSYKNSQKNGSLHLY